MKKLFALLLCLVLMVPALALAETEITLWTYPIGSWSKSDVVDEIVANFNAVYEEYVSSQSITRKRLMIETMERILENADSKVVIDGDGDTLRLLPIEPMVTGVCTLLSGMPAASLTAVLAAKYDQNYQFASQVVFVSTLLSMVTIPLMTLLF